MIIDSPNCLCGKTETTKHYLKFDCPNFTRQRSELSNSLNPQNIKLDTLLFGSPNLSDVENTEIFLKVQKYIIESKRFK